MGSNKYALILPWDYGRDRDAVSVRKGMGFPILTVITFDTLEMIPVSG